MLSHPLKVALIGTGFVAKRRAEALQSDSRVQLTFVSGHTSAHVADFCQKFGLSSLNNWQELVTHPDVDLVMICSINSEHGLMTRLALESGKHVVVEYPLALTAQEGQELIELAQQKNLFLHVEHLEILGELHQVIKQHLPELGKVFYAKYTTSYKIEDPPLRWNFNKKQFGFPLISALSRIHRFTDLFGKVTKVNCQFQWWDQENSDYFKACFAHAQLTFKNGMIGEIVYGKGAVFYQHQNEFEVYGEQGNLRFKGDQGQLLTKTQEKTIQLGLRRGLFAKDTQMVIDHLWQETPLYVTPSASLYALEVAEAARKSAESGHNYKL